MKISHEVPICLLEDSRSFNDYDYALVHLFKEQPQYFDFFKKSLEMGREVILDNSIFELGTAFDSTEYAEWIKELKPTYYIIPDSLEDCSLTIQNAEQWSNYYAYKDLPGKRIGVLQGKTVEEIMICLHKMIELGVDRIGISFDLSLYEKLYPHPNKLISWALGRPLLISRIVEWCRNCDIEVPEMHLLGCSSLLEFSLYTYEDYSFIKSMDSSNPIVHGIEGIKYSLPDLLHKKPSVKLFELIERKLTTDQYKLIRENVYFFRKILKNS